MLKIVLMGPPGSGKGTQSTYLMERYGIPQISAGEMLRKVVADGSPLGQKVGNLLQQGKLVPDDLVISLIRERISQADCRNGFILDGFPRSIEQAEALENAVEGGLDIVLFLAIPHEEIFSRLAGRLTCRNCGAVFQKADRSICPICGGYLYQREDDQRSTVEHRLKVYEEHTAPLVEYYRKRGKLVEVEGRGAPEEVAKRIEQRILQAVDS